MDKEVNKVELQWEDLPLWLKILTVPLGLVLAVVILLLMIVLMCVYAVVVLIGGLLELITLPLILGWKLIETIIKKLGKQNE